MTEIARRPDPAAPPTLRQGGIAARALAASRPSRGSTKLNPEQQQAVEHIDGPLLVLAGAGTGKTRVLTARIAHILATGRAWPSQILAVTFTNKAAREMKNRIGRLIGEGRAEGMPWLGTFHSIGVKILRRHAELVGLRADFTILDTDDQMRLLKQIIIAANIDEKRWPARQLAAAIDGWKNRGLTPDKVPDGEAYAFANGKGRELYAEYQQRLKTLNAADFGDLLTRVPAALPRAAGRARRLPAPLPLHAGGRVPGHQRRPVSLAAAARAGEQEHLLRRRRRPVDLWLARRGGGQHPALRARFSRRRTSSGWSATTARPATSSPPPPA